MRLIPELQKPLLLSWGNSPEPEYLGVVSVSGEDLDKHGIGIMNATAPILVELK